MEIGLMMKRKLFLILAVAVCVSSAAAQTKAPSGWSFTRGTAYSIYSDSSTVQTGEYSVVIEYKDGNAPGFSAISMALPENYEGKTITLSAYIKTENVREGYAGLWMRIDPQIAFDNMYDRGISGSTDWQKYEISLDLNPSKTQQIIIGGLLSGRGKMWIDGIQLRVDEKDIPLPKPAFPALPPAEKDREFDVSSRVVFPEITAQLVSDLELLGRIWGFLKYHHPEVGKGNYQWDYELFRILPAYLKTGNSAERDAFLLKWIEKYGKLPACHDCLPSATEAVLQVDLSWITLGNMSENLKGKMLEIYANRHQGAHYYIEMAQGVGNPVFLHENAYAQFPYPDSGFRLLSLYRYWNMIQYFFPNRHLSDKNWNEVLKEYIPTFLSAQNGLEYELASLQLISEIDDTHASLSGGGDEIATLRGNMYAPFRVEFIEDKLVVTAYYHQEFCEATDLKIGDVITHINGKSISYIVDSLDVYYPASNMAAKLRNIAGNILRSSKEEMTLQYTSSEGDRQETVSLYERAVLNMYPWAKPVEGEKSYKLLNDNIGYVTLATIKAEDIAPIKEAFKHTDGMIIDIRNYPSIFVPFMLGSYFVSEPTPFVKFTVGNINNPGEFNFTPAIIIPDDTETYQGQLMVLVNEYSISQAEYTAMAFRAGRRTCIVGSTTAGADGNVSPIILPGGLRTAISGIGVYYPDGTQTQRVGIIPDIMIRPSIKGIKEGRDEVLEKAVEIIRQGNVGGFGFSSRRVESGGAIEDIWAERVSRPH